MYGQSCLELIVLSKKQLVIPYQLTGLEAQRRQSLGQLIAVVESLSQVEAQRSADAYRA